MQRRVDTAGEEIRRQILIDSDCVNSHPPHAGVDGCSGVWLRSWWLAPGMAVTSPWDDAGPWRSLWAACTACGGAWPCRCDCISVGGAERWRLNVTACGGYRFGAGPRETRGFSPFPHMLAQPPFCFLH